MKTLYTNNVEGARNAARDYHERVEGNGRQFIIETLAKFKRKKVSELDYTQYKPFIEAMGGVTESAKQGK